MNDPITLKADQINMDEVWEMIDKISLFKLTWGLRGRAEKGHEDLLNQWKARIIREEIFEPEIVYGYFQWHNKESVIIENPTGDDIKLVFSYPEIGHLGPNDYFAECNIVAFQSVTVGCKVVKIMRQWNEDHMYTNAYYLHGLAVEVTKSLACWFDDKKYDANFEIGDSLTE